MNRYDIRLLQEIRGYPALSILVPTHRTSPDNKQDPIRVKNAVTEATNRLLSEFSKREIQGLLANLERVVGEIDYPHTLDGLAIFVNNDFGRKFYLPFPVAERVVVDETFATRDLVMTMNRSPRYWVLLLSTNATRLFEGLRDTLVEVTEHRFPLRHSGPGGPDVPLPGGFGVRKSAYRDEYMRKFYREVDAALTEVLKEDPLPVAAIGVDRNLSFLNEVTDNRSAIVATVQGNYDQASPHELGQLLWPVVLEKMRERRRQALEELEAAFSAQRVAVGIEEAWRMAHMGRGQTLLVEEDFHYPGRTDDTGFLLYPAEDPTAAGVMDDAVDDLVEEVLRKGGQVFFMEPGMLEKYQRAALILRY